MTRAGVSPLLLLPLLLLPGCILGRFTENEPFDEEVLAEFQPGKTTAGEVTKLLGPPRRVVELDVRSAYLYEFSQNKSAGLLLIFVNFVNFDERFDRIWLFFDKDDVLTHSGTQLSSHRSRFAMPWVNSHSKERDAEADAERAEERAEEKEKEAERNREAAERASAEAGAAG